MSTGEKFEQAVAIMERLRSPGGCPWDREQTFDTIKPYTLEETYEVLDAIEKRDWQELTGELGDLMLQVLFYAQMAKEDQKFSIDDVLDRMSNKLVARHPHVFGEGKADTSQEVLRNWAALKAQEKSDARSKTGNGAMETSSETAPESALAGISTAMPALMVAYKISSRAANTGFDWPNIAGLFKKLDEEIAELKKEVAEHPEPGPSPRGSGIAGAKEQQVPTALRERMEDEVGDLLFVLVNIARYLSLDPESSLRKTNRKFMRRFQYVESELLRGGINIQKATLDEMERLWQESKQSENSSPELENNS